MDDELGVATRLEGFNKKRKINRTKIDHKDFHEQFQYHIVLPKDSMLKG